MTDNTQPLKGDPAALRIYETLKKEGVKDETLDCGSRSINERDRPVLLGKNNGKIEPQEIYDYVLSRPEQHGDLFVKETGLTLPWSIPAKALRTERMQRYADWLESQVSAVKREIKRAGITEKEPRYVNTLISSLIFMIEGQEPAAMMDGVDKALFETLAEKRAEPPWGTASCPETGILVDQIEEGCAFNDGLRISTYGNALSMAGFKPKWSVIYESGGKQSFFPTIDDDRGNMIFPLESKISQRIVSPRMVAGLWSFHSIASKTQPPSEAIVEALEAATRLVDESQMVHLKKGLWYLEKTGHHDRAESELKGVLKVYPETFIARINLGNALLLQGKLDEAAEEYRFLAGGKAPKEVKVEGWIKLASSLMKLDRPKEAIEAALKAVEMFPENAGIRRFAGITCAAADDKTGAIEQFKAATKLKPDDYETFALLADTHHTSGKTADATAALEEMLSANPGDLEAMVVAAIAFNAIGESSRALKISSEALQKDPSSIKTIRARAYILSSQGKHGEALELISNSISKGNNDSGLAELRATCLFALQKDDEALTSAKEAYALNPSSVSIILLLSKIYSKTGDHAEAVAVLKKINPALLPNVVRAEYHMNLGLALGEANRDEEAREQFQLAADLDSSNELAHFNVAFASLKTGDFDAAIEALQAMKKIAPLSTASSVLLAEAYLKKGDAASAIEALEGAVETDPKNKTLWDELIGHLFQAGESEKAMAVVERRILQFPDDALFLAKLAGEFANAGDTARTIKYAEAALRIDPDNSTAMMAKGVATFKEGMTSIAERNFREATRVDPSNPEAWTLLGHAQMELEKHEAAIESLEKAIETGKSTALTKIMLSKIFLTLERYSDAVFTLENLDTAALNMKHLSLFHLNYGRGLFGLKRHAEAQKHFLEAIENDVSNDIARYYAASSCLILGDLKSALEHALLCHKLNQESDLPIALIGKIYRKMGEYEKSRKAYAAAVALSPNTLSHHIELAISAIAADRPDEATRVADRLSATGQAIALSAGEGIRGLILAKSGAREEALSLLRSALEDEALHSEFAFMAGLISLYLGRVKEAKEHLLLSVKIDETSAAALHCLGIARAMAGDFTGAAESIRQSLKIDPESALAKKNLARIKQKKKPILPPLEKGKATEK